MSGRVFVVSPGNSPLQVTAITQEGADIRVSWVTGNIFCKTNALQRATGTADGTRAPEHPITVLAASSLKAGMTAAGEAYTRSHPKSPVTLGFECSVPLCQRENAAHMRVFRN